MIFILNRGINYSFGFKYQGFVLMKMYKIRWEIHVLLINDLVDFL